MLVALKPSVPLGPQAADSGADRSSTDKVFANAAVATTTPSFPLLAEDRAGRMSNPHRGLPPLTTLSTDSRQPPPSTALTTANSYNSQPLGQLPEAPRSGQGSDDAMRNWLSTKAEEERRRQEEERTKQEGLKLEQRKIEQSMLRESIQAGVPAPMVPMVFAGMGGTDVAKASLEWAQHYMSQMSLQQPGQNQAPLPPTQSDHQRDARTMPGPQANPYATQAPPALPAPPSSAPHGMHSQSNSFGTPYQQPAQDAARFRFQQQDAAVAQRNQPSLSHLNTGGSLAEMQIQQPPPPGGMQMPPQGQTHPSRPQASVPPQQQNSQQSQQTQHNSSPGIYFHHWTPPNTNKEPATPNNKSTHTSPYASHATSHLRHEYASSPKKRRTGGSAGGSVGDKNSENGTATASPQDAESPRFEVLRPGDVAAGARKRGLSNVTNATNITRGDGDRHSNGVPDRQGSVGPAERKRTLSGTPKAEVEVT